MGSFGRHHARVYHQLQKEGYPVELAAIVDGNRDRAEEIAREFGASAFTSLEQFVAAQQTGAGKLDAASVTVPTIYHLATARLLMDAGIDVLIEKPLATSLEEADELIRICSRTQRTAQTGHLERFNPAVQATIPLLNKPMFFECHRLSIFSRRSLDVDVVLDLMIHDLDIVLSFINSPVKEVRAVGLPILSRKVDIANVRVEFSSGCIANFTASRVSTERVRKLRFFQPHEYLSLDFARQDVIRISVDPATLLALQPAASNNSPGAHLQPAVAQAENTQPISFSSAMPGITIAKPVVKPGEPLRAELQAFIQAVRTKTKPLVTLEDGRRALALALDITTSMAEHHRRANLDAITSV